MEQEDRIREPANIVWQTRTHEESAFERRLADTMERAFADGVTELEPLVEYLNAEGVRDEENRSWTVDAFRAVMARLRSVSGVPDPSGEARLEFRGVTKKFQDRQGSGQTITAVQDVTLSVHDGEVVSLIGPSGCGKSTLLNMASGLNGTSGGEVFVDGEEVVEVNEHVAFMLQKDLLLAWRSIRENVELGLEIQGIDKDERRRRSDDWLARCKIADFAEHYPHQLSGGMRQRAALARTLATDPHVLLLDEPFSALDAQTKMILQQDLARTLADAKKTALFITHDLVEAVALSDRVLVMSQRPGTIIEEIVVDIPGRDDPMTRRKSEQIGTYVARLMSLLHVGESELETA